MGTLILTSLLEELEIIFRLCIAREVPADLGPVTAVCAGRDFTFAVKRSGELAPSPNCAGVGGRWIRGALF